MTVTAADLIDALTKATTYDSSHTPKPNSIIVESWLEHFDTFAPTVERTELLAAVTEYHRTPHDRMLQPADISTIARIIHHDTHERSDLNSPQRLAAEARCDAKVLEFPHNRTFDGDAHQQRPERALSRFGPHDTNNTNAAEHITKLANSPLRATCPWCGAQPGDPCTVMVPTRNTEKRWVRLRNSRAHPSRYQAAGIPQNLTARRTAIENAAAAQPDQKPLNISEQANQAATNHIQTTLNPTPNQPNHNQTQQYPTHPR